MINHPDLTRQLVTRHYQDLLADAEHHRRARECRAAPSHTARRARRRLPHQFLRQVRNDPKPA